MSERYKFHNQERIETTYQVSDLVHIQTSRRLARLGKFLTLKVMDDFELIKKFVAQQRWEYDFPLTRETTLRKELKLWGDDAVDFIVSFSKEFKVDISTLHLNKYFPPEGDRILTALFRLLSLKEKPKYFTLTLGDLEQAVKNGRLE